MNFYDCRFLVLLYSVLLAVKRAVVSTTELAFKEHNVVATRVIIDDSIDLLAIILGKSPCQRHIEQCILYQLNIGLLSEHFPGCNGRRLCR